MSKFIDNMNVFITAKKIKQSFIALKTGMNVNKISRILKGAQSATEEDMEALANALGYHLDYFLSPNFKLEHRESETEQIAFYSGNMESVKSEVVGDCISLLENIHSILGRQQTLLNQINEELYADH